MNSILLVANSARSMLLFREYFIKELLGLGFTVIVCAPYEDVSFKKLEKLGVKVESLHLSRRSMNPLREFLTIMQIRKILLRNRPRICILYTIKPIIYGSIAYWGLKKDGIYSMVSGLGYVFIKGSFPRKILSFFIKVLYRIALRNNKQVFFLNKDDKDYFISNKIIHRSQACLLNGEGVDLEYYKFTVPSARRIIFLFIGRLLRDKGIYEYVSAARILKIKYPDIVFKVVGDLDDNPSVINADQLQSWIDGKFIDYCGYLADVKPVLEQSSIFVLPSYREGTSRAILEAMAIGRPIITTDAPGCRDTVIEGVNGYLIAVKNVNQLVVAMERFILSPELISCMGNESRRLAENKYNVSQVNKIILKALDIV